MAGPTVNDLVQQRSMLVILLAACRTAQTAFEAADNLVDRQLLLDLTSMIKRSEDELAKLTVAIGGVRA